MQNSCNCFTESTNFGLEQLHTKKSQNRAARKLEAQIITNFQFCFSHEVIVYTTTETCRIFFWKKISLIQPSPNYGYKAVVMTNVLRIDLDNDM